MKSETAEENFEGDGKLWSEKKKRRGILGIANSRSAKGSVGARDDTH